MEGLATAFRLEKHGLTSVLFGQWIYFGAEFDFIVRCLRLCGSASPFAAKTFQYLWRSDLYETEESIVRLWNWNRKRVAAHHLEEDGSTN